MVLPDDGLGYDAKQDRVDVQSVKINVEFGNMYTKEIEAFSRSILNGAAIDIPGEDALQVQKVVEAAYESNSTGKFIDIL